MQGLAGSAATGLVWVLPGCRMATWLASMAPPPIPAPPAALRRSYLPGLPERPMAAGLNRLRTARVLEEGMVITVEPGGSVCLGWTVV